jgi:hypothetical protein
MIQHIPESVPAKRGEGGLVTFRGLMRIESVAFK